MALASLRELSGTRRACDGVVGAALGVVSPQSVVVANKENTTGTYQFHFLSSRKALSFSLIVSGPPK